MSELRHTDQDTLERFSRGALSAEQAQWIEDHLRSGCPVCQHKMDGLLMQLQPSEPWAQEEQMWSRLLVKMKHRKELIARERAVAPGLVEELMAALPGEREMLLRSGRFQTAAVCELLIERSSTEGFQDPAQARELAELAVRVADRLDILLYDWSVVQDFRARAWAYLGNARRLASDLEGAEEAISLARSFSEEGSADLLAAARILDFKASLLADQGRLEEAAELLDVAVEIYDDIRDTHRKGRALISKGLFLSYAGQPEQSLDWISRGLKLICGEQEPRLVLMAHHNIAWCLTDCGRAEEAQRHLDGIRHLYDGFSDPWTRLRLDWLEARIAAGLGRREEAERKLKELRDAFVEQKLGYEASIVTLDLAALYLEQERTADVRRLAEESLPVLLAQDIHREAMAALIVFQQATEIERATPRMVRQVAAYLYRSRNNPELRFAGWELAGE
jgi:tetratricopeptide (TPR) repeat protein